MSNQPAINLDQLLQMAAAATRSGNKAAARALFLALGREYPNDTRVWRGLAAVAADPDEQRMALKQVRTLDLARKGANTDQPRLDETNSAATDPNTTSTRPELVAPTIHAPPLLPPEPAQPAHDELEAPRAPFPLLNLIALLLILLLLAVVGGTIGRNFVGNPTVAIAPSASPILAVIPDSGSSSGSTLSATTSATLAPTVGTIPTSTRASISAASTGITTATLVPTTTPVTSTTPIPSPTDLTVPTSAPSTELPLGQIIDYDGWSATLLRPDYAVALDGAIGVLQPTGRFVLAVVAVSNNSPIARAIPQGLFTLTDSAGQHYTPLPGASTAYLALYERGQRGDLALEDTLDPGSGMRSVPILFDVPLNANGLRLTIMGAAGAGWPIGDGGPTTVGP